MTTQTLSVHLSTDVATGELTVSFIPKDNSHLPFSVGKWSDYRDEKLKPQIQEQLNEQYSNGKSDDYTLADGYKTILSSDRLGGRYDVSIGYVEVNEKTESHNIMINPVDTLNKLENKVRE